MNLGLQRPKRSYGDMKYLFPTDRDRYDYDTSIDEKDPFDSAPNLAEFSSSARNFKKFPRRYRLPPNIFQSQYR